jgi:hypothetical protein
MAKATHNLSVKVGEYTNAQGETKGRWKNVGRMIASDDGSNYLIMDRTFNPAGVVNPDNRDAITISLFPVEEQQAAAPQRAPQRAAAVAPVAAVEGFDDDIPF